MELEADVLERLEAYVAEFAAGFGYITRPRWAGVYLQGLFLDGERKSIEPLSHRVSVPGWRGDTEQALQQFVNQSIWDEQAVLQTAGPNGGYPLALRLFLPESWTSQPERMAAARVPLPHQGPRTKHEIALD